MKWNSINNLPSAGYYVVRSKDQFSDNFYKNELYLSENGKWYLSKDISEKYPDKNVSTENFLEWLDESDMPIENPFILRRFDSKKWYWCKCENCGWEDSSEFCEGGHPIADTGDYSDPLCPICFSNKIEGEFTLQIKEGNDGIDEVIIPLDTFIDPYKKTIAQLNKIIDEKQWSQTSLFKPGHEDKPFHIDTVKVIINEHVSIGKLTESLNEKVFEWFSGHPVSAELEVMIKTFDEVRKIFELRAWIMEGRGLYPYNDDRYKEEVRHMYNDFDALQKHTWKNIKSKSVDFRNKVIADYLVDKQLIPRSIAFSIANKFYGSDYPLQQSQFDTAAEELGY